MIFCMKRLSTEPKPILFALASLLCTSTVWAVDDLEQQVSDRSKVTQPVVKKSAAETTTPSVSIMADASFLIVADAKASIGAVDNYQAVTANDKLSSPDAAVFENEKSKNAEAQPAI